MLEPSLFALSWRVTRRRLSGSPLAALGALGLPVLVVWLGVVESYATAAKFFYFLLPHVFLVAAQDAVRSDIDSGALENVLFVGGRFRGYLASKGLALAVAVSAYATCLFALISAWGLAAGAFEPRSVVRFALALVAGLYYLAWAGALSYLMRAGSNVLAILLAQSAALIGLVLSTTSRAGLLDYAATGRFPGLGPKLLFGALTALLPNVVVSARLSVFTAEVLAGLVLAVLVQGRLARGLEIRHS
ncbi:MAG TPA: hypothetical protein ENO03_06660 [Candidatus Aminicenantes bacterium]|nr:hypothetical protein [Candidatus Aminicenantes bacterium]HDT14022.1 hypothetical protein [Candidatus Aminicenantes bacterium]